MRNKIYIVHYKATDENHNLVKAGKMRVKNCFSEFNAQCKLENYIKKKFNSVQNFIVFRIYEDTMLNSLFNSFGESYKS